MYMWTGILVNLNMQTPEVVQLTSSKTMAIQLKLGSPKSCFIWLYNGWPQITFDKWRKILVIGKNKMR